jgi:hypothetical protein
LFSHSNGTLIKLCDRNKFKRLMSDYFESQVTQSNWKQKKKKRNEKNEMQF